MGHRTVQSSRPAKPASLLLLLSDCLCLSASLSVCDTGSAYPASRPKSRQAKHGCRDEETLPLRRRSADLTSGCRWHVAALQLLLSSLRDRKRRQSLHANSSIAPSQQDSTETHEKSTDNSRGRARIYQRSWGWKGKWGHESIERRGFPNLRSTGGRQVLGSWGHPVLHHLRADAHERLEGHAYHNILRGGGHIFPEGLCLVCFDRCGTHCIIVVYSSIDTRSTCSDVSG